MTKQSNNLLESMSLMDMISDQPGAETEEKSTIEGVDGDVEDLTIEKPAAPVEAAQADEPAEPIEGAADQAADEPPDSIIGNLIQQFGITLEEGEAYEDTEDGLINFTKKAAEHMAVQNLEQFFEKLPDVKQYMEYRMNDGDPAKYFQSQTQTDYSSVELKETDINTQKTVLTELFKRQGYDKADIDETLTDYEETGILYKQSKKAQTKLSGLVSAEKQLVLAEAQTSAANAEKKNTEYWENIQGTIDKGELKGIQIPVTEKKKFFDWMNKPIDKQGNTARALQRKDMDMQTLLALEFMFYKKLDLGGLVTAKAKTIQAQTLQERLKTDSPGVRMGKSKSTPATRVKLPNTSEIF